MTCPNCQSGDYEEYDAPSLSDGQGYQWGTGCTCNNCGCEWELVTTKKITKEGKVIEEK